MRQLDMILGPFMPLLVVSAQGTTDPTQPSKRKMALCSLKQRISKLGGPSIGPTTLPAIGYLLGTSSRRTRVNQFLVTFHVLLPWTWPTLNIFCSRPLGVRPQVPMGSALLRGRLVGSRQLPLARAPDEGPGGASPVGPSDRGHSPVG